ncbi:MAG: hypothetical protein ACRETH_03310, partial [Steroidobacteraceae bacterium]
MPDSVLAAIIAGTATLSASFLQLRSAALRDGARGQSTAATRRKSRVQRVVLLVIIGAAGVSGFALSQWLTDGERAAQLAREQELQAGIAQISRTAKELELTRSNARAEIQSSVLREIGTDGVAVAATVPACRPAAVRVAAPASTPVVPTAAGTPSAQACIEADASPVTLCASIPAAAKVTEVVLLSRLAEADTPWSASR